MIAVSKYHLTEDQIQEEYLQIEEAKEDPSRFEILYNKYHEQIFRYIHQKLNDKELAYDLTSQVFLKAMVNLKKYEFRGVPFASWLYRIASNELNAAFKRNGDLRTLNIETCRMKEMADETEECMWENYEPEVAKAMSELPEGELQIIEMRFFHQMSFKQIGEILSLTESNAKMKLYRTLEKLKKKIQPKLK